METKLAYFEGEEWKVERFKSLISDKNNLQVVKSFSCQLITSLVCINKKYGCLFFNVISLVPIFFENFNQMII